MLRNRELAQLLTLLNSKDTVEHTLEAFHRTIIKSDAFKYGCAVCVLFQDNLLTRLQRVVAFSVLHDLFRGEALWQNPFFAFFYDVIERGTNAAETRFLLRLLSTAPDARDVLKKGPQQILEDMLIMEDETLAAYRPDLAGMRAKYVESAPPVPGMRAVGLRPVIVDPEEDDGYTAANAAALKQLPPDTEVPLEDMALDDGPMGGSLSLLGFEPAFVRPLPPLLEPTDAEVLWLNPDYAPQLLWERPLHTPGSGADASDAELREQMARAFAGSLAPPQVDAIVRKLRAEPRLVYTCGLTPQRLPELVEANPPIAVQCLLTVMASPQMTEYLSALVNMEMSVHSMEVVNRLVHLPNEVVRLPDEFIHLYISNCISSCENIKDKYLQNRLVRLVCVFLQSLIRKDLLNVSDLFIEVQAFCIEFSRIREAAGLFRLLKTLDRGASETS